MTSWDKREATYLMRTSCLKGGQRKAGAAPESEASFSDMQGFLWRFLCLVRDRGFHRTYLGRPFALSHSACGFPARLARCDVSSLSPPSSKREHDSFLGSWLADLASRFFRTELLCEL